MYVRTDIDLVPFEDDYDASRDLPFIEGMAWTGEAGCIACSCDLEEVGRMDNCVVLACPGCGMHHKALEHHRAR